MHRLVITPGQLTLQDMRRLLMSPTVLSLEPSACAAIDASVATVAGVIDEGLPRAFEYLLAPDSPCRLQGSDFLTSGRRRGLII